MKVYSLPDEVTFPQPDYRNYDVQREQEREAAHQERVKKWLIEQGYKGKRTGEILQIGHADGYAQYMLAEGSRSFLVHLPYGDAWDSPLANKLTKSEVLRRIENTKALREMFSKKKGA